MCPSRDLFRNSSASYEFSLLVFYYARRDQFPPGPSVFTTHQFLHFSKDNNIHTKISAFWLAESISINPKQRKNLKFFWECRKTKLVQKVEIKNDWHVPWKTITKKQNGGQACWEQPPLNSQLEYNGKNKNTQQSTSNWINVWTNRILVSGEC